ncbi:pyroglutamyl peptidase [Streptomyces sp. Ru87]|uniref:pyroglutamyl peptidase n=1 Tax=Streptomyces sp. Ru87 TaxID=2044307 RepID=UPI00211D4A54|nr:pyroglutamyl peptidase [Streptomyces sp. Ru87]
MRNRRTRPATTTTPATTTPPSATPPSATSPAGPAPAGPAPARRTRPRGALLTAAVLTGALAVPLAGAPAAGTTAAAAAEPTYEEQFLTDPEPQEILRRSGFDTVASDFTAALGGVDSPEQARSLTERSGEELWQRAVDRAQGRGPDGGDLSRSDDRPLYWARLGMTTALRTWEPSAFELTDTGRADLLNRLERTSRGHTSIDLPPDGGGGGTGEDTVKRVLVTGFDPFQLNFDRRQGNPSGAAALALDGTTINTPSGPARVETAVFPVRWDDFADGMVEQALLPHFEPGPSRVDLFTTISQGRPEQFDVERYNGAWRGGYQDNNGLGPTGVIPVPPGVPTVEPQPQWTTTSLPYEAMTTAPTGDFTVVDNTAVREIPAGSTEEVPSPDGPTPGSEARQGSGGNYLSNEIAYRATLLRDAVELDVPGGHLHTPVLAFGSGNNGEIQDPEFIANREAITAQIRELVRVAAGTTS